MREERGQITGDLVVSEPFTLWGSVGGSVRVVNGGKFYLRGTVIGDLIVEQGGRVHIFGSVAGNLTLAPDSKVIHSGLIGGSALNEGGRLFIEPAAKIAGRVRTKDGSTRIAPRESPIENTED